MSETTTGSYVALTPEQIDVLEQQGCTVEGSDWTRVQVADGFVAFDSLTKDQVVAWVIDKLDVSEADIQAALAQRIADDRDPPVVQKLPAGW